MFMEMGTGKTLGAIGTIGYRYAWKEVKRVLIVAPLSVTTVWRDEFQKHVNFPYVLSLATGRTPKEKKRCFESITAGGTAVAGNLVGARDDPVWVVVVSYDSVIERKSATGHTASGLLGDILAWKPDMVICDESQRIKNKDSKRSEALHEIGDALKYKMILSGTPVTNSPLDVWSQYRFLDRLVFGDSFYSFRGRYATMHKQMAYSTGRTFTVIDGYKNLDDLTEKAHSIAYRITKEEALDLPEFVDETLHCDLSALTREHYKSMEKEARLAIESVGVAEAPVVLTKLLRLAQITGGLLPMTDDDGDWVNGKLPVPQPK
jgi:SNF2 family DNA or RNA helicase